MQREGYDESTLFVFSHNEGPRTRKLFLNAMGIGSTNNNLNLSFVSQSASLTLSSHQVTNIHNFSPGMF